MKHFLSILLVLLLTAAFASAETVVTTVDLSSFYRLDLNMHTNTLYGQKTRGDGYAVFDLDGNTLSVGSYSYLYPKEYGYEATVQGDTNCKGFLDGQGNEIIPPQYGDVEVFSDRWCAGIFLAPATADNYDYSSWGSDKQFYLIDHVDVYYRGTMVGTLDRSDYSSTPYAYGDYLYMRNREGNYQYFNKSLEKSGYSESGSSEFDSVYKKGKTTFYHRGSNQIAFAAGCTLTPDEVSASITDDNGLLLDLQGNTIATLQYDSIRSFENGYAKVRNQQRLYGLIDTTGREVVPCLYSDLDMYGPICGYLSVVKDGKQGFVSLSDGSETGFLYSESAVKVRSPFAFITDLDGSTIVMSAAVGVLPTRYAEYERRHDNTSPLCVVKNAAGAVGVIGLAGEEIIPPDGRYDRTYDLTVSRDGTVVLGTDGILYLIDYDLGSLPQQTADAVPTAADSVPSEDGWTCPICGKVNSADANFCPGDATAKPVASAEWTCPTCGKANPADANFCPNDAAAKPVASAEWTCPTCGKVNPANANFCPNDAVPKP